MLMKKWILSLFAISAIHTISFAQDKVSVAPKLSPLTRQYLNNPAHEKGPMSGYVYRKDAAGKLYISALLQANKNLTVEALQQIGIIVGTRAGDVWTVQVPLDQVAVFTKIAGASYIQLDEPVFPAMDSVRKVTRVDSVHAGVNLPSAFSGKGVVLGILDVGFDYTHPLFSDTSGTGYRVRKIWEEKSTGTPPAGFSFGNEITDPAVMHSTGTDIATQSHGTHVAGIAGGSGMGSNSTNTQYRGIAFSSDVVLVGITPPQSQWMNTGMTDLIDGMNYVYSYAGSVGKPAVVNLSWGCSVGSHDGLSLFSRAVDNLTGTGKLFVCSAGNNGSDAVHLQKIMTASDTLLNTFVTFSEYLDAKKIWVDIWGDSAKSFCARVTLYNGSAAGNTTGYICLDNTTHSQYLIGAAGDTCFVDMSTSSAEFNGKPRIFITLYNKGADAVNLTIKSSDAKMNLFEGYVQNSSGYYGAFTNGGFSWAVNGTTSMTTSDFATTNSAISVGAFAARNSFVNVSGGTENYTNYVSRGRIVPFSSRGPTLDGRVSPHIAAPGFLVASGVNSYDTSFQPNGSNYSEVVNSFTSNGRDYHYAMLSGTSMSGPVVAGIVALMLEADPKLDPWRAKDIIAQTAILDVYTGALTAAGNNTWGHGKVNAYAAIKRVIQTQSINQVTGTGLIWSLYPNPGNGVFHITCSAAKQEVVKVEVCDMMGRILLQKDWQLGNGNNATTLDATGFARGIYFTRLTTGKQISTIKMLVE